MRTATLIAVVVISIWAIACIAQLTNPPPQPMPSTNTPRQNEMALSNRLDLTAQEQDEVWKQVERFIATNKTSIRLPDFKPLKPPFTVIVGDAPNTLTLTNCIALIPDHEPGCHLVRWVQDGHTNEFHAWQVNLEVKR